MSEIRIDKRKNEEYACYSESIQQYHKYDVFEEELSDNKVVNDQYVSEMYRKQLLILACMTEDEYTELQKSIEKHIVQKKIRLARQRQELMKLVKESSDGKIYPYCIERINGDICYPIAVFSLDELEQAKAYASNEFERNRDGCSSIQLSEGLFGKDGNVLGNSNVTFVIDEWSNE